MMTKKARRVVPHLSSTAFVRVRENLGEHVMARVSSEQMKHFGEGDEDYRCEHLDLTHLSGEHSIDPKCFAVAASKASAPVKLNPRFLSKARPDLFDAIEPEDAAKVLQDGSDWTAMNKELVDKILARGAPFCRLLKAPDLGKALKVTLISAACFREVPAAHQIGLLRSPNIYNLAENALEGMTADGFKSVEELASLLILVARTRSAVLGKLGEAPDGLHICSILHIVKDADKLGQAAKHLPKKCYLEMQGRDSITHADLAKLNERALEAVDMSSVVASMKFNSIKRDEWYSLKLSICSLMIREQFNKVDKKFVFEAASGACVSELSFDLTKEEIVQLSLNAIAGTSETFVARYYKLFSLAQFGALGANAKGIASFADVSVEHVHALTPTAMKSVQPSAFKTLDLPKFHAIEPGATEVITLAQISQVKPEIVVKLNADQAKHLGKLVTDKNQNPKLLFDKELYEQLDPKTKEFIEPSAAINLRVGIVPMVIAAACVLAMA